MKHFSENSIEDSKDETIPNLPRMKLCVLLFI